MKKYEKPTINEIIVNCEDIILQSPFTIDNGTATNNNIWAEIFD